MGDIDSRSNPQYRQPIGQIVKPMADNQYRSLNSQNHAANQSLASTTDFDGSPRKQ